MSDLGARIAEGGVRYTVWAPEHESLSVLVGQGEGRRAVPLQKNAEGYFEGLDPQGRAGDLYVFLVNGEELPDPASRFQPLELLGPSQVIDSTAYAWQNNDCKRPAWGDRIVYELHVGAFTPEGTYRAAIERLPHLQELGVNTVEVMPVASFEGSRNWGYDGALLYAPTKHYGTPDDLRAFIDAAHGRGLAVILDVVYNHLGLPSDYLGKYASRYFLKTRETVWGPGFNWDGPDSGPVRHFFLSNALYWLDEFRFDGLRLDATHAIVDESPRHFVAELAEAAQARGACVIAEDDRNEARVITPRGEGGWGCNAVWADDFHYSVRIAITGEGDFHYGSYRGTIIELVEILSHGWFYKGEYDPHRETTRGTYAAHLPFDRFLVCISNHDQTGNRVLGDRLHHIVSPQDYRAASLLLCLAPFTPMFFMGQEWGATTTFPFFTEYSGERHEKISQWRKEELVRSGVREDSPMFAVMPNPQAPETFQDAKLKWDELGGPPHRGLLALYRAGLRWRRQRPVSFDRKRVRVEQLAQTVAAIRWDFDEESWLLLFTLRGAQLDLKGEPFAATEHGRWELAVGSNELRFGGEGDMSFDPVLQRVDLRGPETLLLVSGHDPA